jgi:hypothetical protein
MRPARISASKNPWALPMRGARASSMRVDAGGPMRLTSRTRPSSSGLRAATRKTALTIASTRGQPVPARSSVRSSVAASSDVEWSITALSRASLLGNQYRIVCLRMPRVAARSSSEVASKPRVPKEVKAASTMRSLVLTSAFTASVYHLVDRCADDP